ncbi:hypothetical protein GCM10010309_80090 [Streptomyces violaceochromogenes]|nr:hypothetical protein GCM10010309_80090 [Streptomyces violaceochromogenes]
MRRKGHRSRRVAALRRNRGVRRACLGGSGACGGFPVVADTRASFGVVLSGDGDAVLTDRRPVGTGRDIFAAFVADRSEGIAPSVRNQLGESTAFTMT